MWDVLVQQTNVYAQNRLETDALRHHQGSKLGWTGGLSLPKIPSDHQTEWGSGLGNSISNISLNVYAE